MREPGGEGGFTLIELVVVLAIIAVLSAVLTPLFLKYMEDAKVARAETTVKTIQEQMLQAFEDLRRFPIAIDGTKSEEDGNVFNVLRSDGVAPTAAALGWGDLTQADALLSRQLITNAVGYPTTGRFKWKGAYAQELPPDPWQRAYVAQAKNLRRFIPVPDRADPNTANAAFLCSAGPDGILQTSAKQSGANAVVSGDDICARIK